MFEKMLRPQDKFRYFNEPIMTNFPYEKIEKGPFSPPAEWAIEFSIDGNVHSALVPSFSVNEDKGTAQVALIGKKDTRVLIGFAPTQLGSNKFFVDERSLVEMIPSLKEYR